MTLLSLQKLLSSRYLGRKGPLTGHFVFFRNFFHFIFLKTVWKANSCDNWLPISNSMSGKNVGLELLRKILPTYQIMEGSCNSHISSITGITKMVFLWVSYKPTELGLTWLGMARSIHNYAWEIYSNNRYGQVSIVYWILINWGPYEINVVCLSLTVSISQFNIFHRSRWLLFFWFF